VIPLKKNYYEEDGIALKGIDKEEFVENMYNWINDDEVTYYMYTGIRPANTEKLDDEYKNLISGENVIFSVIDLKNKRTVGFAGLYNISWQARHAEFRIIMGDKNTHGKGIGTIVTSFLVRYAFEKLNLNKVWLGVNAKNAGAVRCYEKAGFAKEGTLRQEIYRNGVYYDALRMSVLREEYDKKTKPKKK
jgi:RimJ/RimL family protein N-acetyltransferase